MNLPFIRAAIRQMEAYVPGEQPAGGGYIKLNTNESPYPASPAVAEAIRAELERLPLYPETSSRLVREAAAEVFGVPADWVLAANGSDETLRLICQVCGDPARPLAAFYPSYTYYRTLAAAQGMAFRQVEFPADYLLPELTELRGAGAVFLPNPNAPSGTILSPADIERLCRELPGTLIVVDEAYADFSGQTVLPLLSTYANLFVTRTFSKSYSLAGLRLGLGFARPEVLAQIHKARDHYNLDRLAQVGAAAALRDQAHMRANCAKVIATRERLRAELEKMGVFVWPSAGNFLLARFGRPQAQELYQGLKARKILVRFFNAPRLDDCLRISIGTDAEIDALLQNLRQLK